MRYFKIRYRSPSRHQAAVYALIEKIHFKNYFKITAIHGNFMVSAYHYLAVREL